MTDLRKRKGKYTKYLNKFSFCRLTNQRKKGKYNKYSSPDRKRKKVNKNEKILTNAHKYHQYVVLPYSISIYNEYDKYHYIINI